MKLSKIAALLMLPVLALTLAACSAPKGDAKDATSGDTQIAELVAQKPSSAEEAAELYQQLLQCILSSCCKRKTRSLRAITPYGKRCFLRPTKTLP